jgi:hypothetical protein
MQFERRRAGLPDREGLLARSRRVGTMATSNAGSAYKAIHARSEASGRPIGKIIIPYEFLIFPSGVL